ncbi:Uncharacterised protein [BD1-7 clade bacterium]|uniref:Type VI secretion system-associated lipoprotein n=1 Tax=BD1-7 clade bacterium TaxID=2029982 RepID=A0A5S9QMS1_9GAMM|nr:Uncharacterised protein [BD1-7 clade bacterium]CAA0116126.1 Uncharacterised protein [BD1-7 clade bacterium]CAA0119793.1 Uncharacterised protein [BD1-7 clade bacterium]
MKSRLNPLTKMAALLTATMMLLLSTACSSNKNKDLEVDTYLNTSSTINPDISGESRPVNLSIFYLTDVSNFTKAGFYDLYSKPEQTLGDQLLKVTRLQAQADEDKEIELDAPPETKAIAVIAAFRDVDQAKWGDHVLTPEKCFMGCKPGLKGEELVIEVKRLSVDIALKD